MSAVSVPHVECLESRGTRIRILSLERSPGGFVAWLAVSPAASGVVAVVGGAGGPRAAARGLRVEETGEVSALRVIHEGDTPALLVGDVIVAGGLQTRMLERTVVVAPRSVTVVPARCVERGRWAPRGDGSPELVPEGKPSAWMKRSMRNARARAYRTSRELTADQSRVWAHVEDECTRSRSMTPTGSYEGYLRSVRAAHVRAARESSIGAPPPDANGAVLSTGAGAVVEIYPSHDALAADAEELLADLFDDSLPPPREASSPEAARHAAHRVVAKLLALPLEPVAPVPGTLGEPRVLAGRGLVGTCLYLDGALVHLAASRADRTRAEG